MMNKWKKVFLAVAGVVALNIIGYTLAFGLIRSRQDSSEKIPPEAGYGVSERSRKAEQDPVHSSPAIPAMVSSKKEAGVSSLTLLLTIGGFFIVLGLSLGFYIFARRFTRSIRANPDDAQDSSNKDISPEAILISMTDGLIALDSNLKIIFVNPCFYSMFEIEKEIDWRGLSLLEFGNLAGLEGKEELTKTALDVLFSGIPAEQTIECNSTGAARRFFHFSAAPLKTEAPETPLLEVRKNSYGQARGVVIVGRPLDRVLPS
jgi:PAS domain-containing protein